jgi:hypothetical protein
MVSGSSNEVHPLPDPEVEPALRGFVADGRIVSMPAKQSRRLVLLDYCAQRFEPGVQYPEAEVNSRLRELHHDYAMLRRYLVDYGLLTREAGRYWRSGGTVDV